MSTSLPRARLGSGAGASPRSSPRPSPRPSPKVKDKAPQHPTSVSGVAVEQQKSSQRSQKPVRTGQVGRAGSNAEQHADKAQQQKVKIDLVGDKRGMTCCDAELLPFCLPYAILCSCAGPRERRVGDQTPASEQRNCKCSLPTISGEF